MKKLGPYIGVTGFMSRSEVNAALAAFPKNPVWRLMIGVLMSSKTLAGQTNRWPGRFPKREAVADIFINNPRILNLVHYSTDDPWTLSSQLEEIIKIVGPNLDGFQLNIAWPPISDIEDFWKTHPDKFLVLQIGNAAMRYVGPTEKFATFLKPYLPMIDAILMDPSGGKGEPFDAEKVVEYLREISKSWLVPGGLGIGVAGGLGPETFHLLDPLLWEFPELSIDAEGKLRTPQPEDALNIDAVCAYLDEAMQVLTGW
jgi:hypothetical protein